jgi:hypothetical protein
VKRQGEEGGFIDNIAKTEAAWNEESRFWSEWNGLEWRKLVSALLELLGMEEVGFGLTEMVWNRGSLYWPYLKCLEWKTSVLD